MGKSSLLANTIDEGGPQSRKTSQNNKNEQKRGTQKQGSCRSKPAMMLKDLVNKMPIGTPPAATAAPTTLNTDFIEWVEQRQDFDQNSQGVDGVC